MSTEKYSDLLTDI
jgi:hypothetical protein